MGLMNDSLGSLGNNLACNIYNMKCKSCLKCKDCKNCGKHKDNGVELL